MCGRMCCCLCKSDIIAATRTYAGSKSLNWIDTASKKHVTGYNIAPTQVTPILVECNGIDASLRSDCMEQGNAICSMRWGLIPSTFRQPLNQFNISTHNCRMESIQEKHTFKTALRLNRRCVVLADGFFEWQTVHGTKKPFFIYFNQELDMKNRDWSTIYTKDDSSDENWKGPRLLTMAGIFDIYSSPEDLSQVYSYSILTCEARGPIANVHHRMPVILDGVDAVSNWLSSDYTSDEALSYVTPSENVTMYEVSRVVNNSSNNSISCVKPSSSVGIKNWFQKMDASGSSGIKNASGHTFGAPNTTATSTSETLHSASAKSKSSETVKQLCLPDWFKKQTVAACPSKHEPSSDSNKRRKIH